MKESDFVERRWYLITPMDSTDDNKYIGRFIEASDQFNMVYFEGVSRLNEVGKFDYIGEMNFVMGSYSYTRPSIKQLSNAKTKSRLFQGGSRRKKKTKLGRRKTYKKKG